MLDGSKDRSDARLVFNKSNGSRSSEPEEASKSRLNNRRGFATSDWSSFRGQHVNKVRFKMKNKGSVYFKF